jgi:hypothetical protein
MLAETKTQKHAVLTMKVRRLKSVIVSVPCVAVYTTLIRRFVVCVNRKKRGATAKDSTPPKFPTVAGFLSMLAVRYVCAIDPAMPTITAISALIGGGALVAYIGIAFLVNRASRDT